MNNDNKVETAIAGLNCWASYATAYEKRLSPQVFHSFGLLSVLTLDSSNKKKIN